MRKSARWTLAGAALALLAGAMAVPWPFAGPDLNGQIAQQLSAATGLPAQVGARVTFALLPSPQLKFRDVIIGDGDSPVRLEAAQVKGKLRLLPLVAGRFEVSGLHFQSPAIRINSDALAIWTAPPASAVSPFTGAVTIAGGQATVASAGREAEVIDDIDLTMNWRGVSAPSAVGGHGAWRGQQISLSALLGRPGDVLRGRSTTFTLDLKSSFGELKLDGDISIAPRFQLNGAAIASTGDIAALLKWTGYDASLANGVERVRATGNARILNNSLSLSGLALNVNDNLLTGTLTFLRDDGKPSISGTLASKTVSFDPRGTAWSSLLAGHDGSWSRELLPIGILSDLNFDLRLSTNSLRLGQISTTDAALTAMAKDGRIELSLSAARAYGGSMKARMSVLIDNETPRLRGQVQFEKLDAAAFLRDALAATRLAGTAAGDIEFRSHGYSIHEFVANLHGAARTSILKGALAGIDIDRALTQYQKQPLSMPSELRSGRTIFNRASLAGVVENGVLQLTEASGESDTLLMRFGGAVSLPARSLRIDIDAARPQPAQTLAPQTTAAASGVAPQLKLDLNGFWSDPELRLDVEGLISSSEAAAPLLRALKRSNGSPATPANTPANTKTE